MTADIVERLRSAGDRDEGRPYSTMHEAANKIERLREEVEALRLVATSHEPEALRLQAEVEHLRTTIGYLADNISDYPALVAVAEAALKPRP